MTTTTASQLGHHGSYAYHIDQIINYLDGGDWADGELDTVADAVFAAFRDEVDARLPEGATWQPRTSEIVHPVNVEIPTDDDLADIFEGAWAAVEARIQDIEAEALATPETSAPTIEITDTDQLPEDRAEVHAPGATFHLTEGEARHFLAEMAACERTADQLGGTGEGTGVTIGGHHWSVARDAAWTMIVDQAADVDVLCQVLDDGRLENVAIHSDDTGN